MSGNLLIYAIQSNDINIVRYVINVGINIKYQQNFTILKNIIYKNNFDLLKLFVPEYFDVNSRDEEGYSLLQYAIRIRNSSIIVFLLKLGAQKNNIENLSYNEMKYFIKNEDILGILLSLEYNHKKFNEEEFKSLIIDAINTENVTIIQYIINILAMDLNITIKNVRCSPLIWAIRIRNIQVVKSLIEKGANINFVDEEGNIPLISAIENHHSHLIYYLVEKGVEVNSSMDINHHIHTPLSYILSQKNNYYFKCHMDEYQSILKHLIDAGAIINDEIVLKVCIDYEDEEFLSYLKEKGVSIPSVMIHYANFKGNKTMANLILNNNESLQKENGQTPLLLKAIKDNNEEFLKYLIEKGITIKNKNENDDTLLKKVMKKRNINMIELLVHHNILQQDQVCSYNSILSLIGQYDKELAVAYAFKIDNISYIEKEYKN
ncbi:hypothetical protein PIROE2DRAFT_7979 [Piromyces sp. E2]|nr:hypothetical protein PIROE2DRAFT_7979 [Piromyces sp. E2]|eukprot:OUM65089.1 hypothetical protein PIROE2DRAFT_7979 [Piromyces sp. E2]